MDSIDRRYWPPFQERLEATLLACAGQGRPYVRGLGTRSMQAQEALYAQGRTIPGKVVTWAHGGSSCHNYGFAEDELWYPRHSERPSDNPDDYGLLLEEGQKQGLQVGVPGRPDYGHVQIPVLEWFGCPEKVLLAMLRSVLVQDGLEACWERLNTLRLKGKIS